MWISIHVYVVEGWKWLLILFNVVVSCWRFPCWQFNKGYCRIFILIWWSFTLWFDFEACMFWNKWCDDVLGFKDWGYSAIEGKACAILVKCALCYASNQFSHVDIVFIVLGCKNWGVVPSCLQLFMHKTWNSLWKKLSWLNF